MMKKIFYYTLIILLFITILTGCEEVSKFVDSYTKTNINTTNITSDNSSSISNTSTITEKKVFNIDIDIDSCYLMFTFDGTIKEFIIPSDLIPEGIEVVYKNNKGINAGNYDVVIEFTDTTDSYIISNAIVNLTMTINKVKVETPVLDNNKVTYDSFEHEFLKSNDIYSVSNNKATNAGKYSLDCILNDPLNYEWEDSNFNGKIEYEILKAKYDMKNISFVNKTYVYDLKEHELLIDGILPSGVSVSYTNNKLTDIGKIDVFASFTGDYLNYEEINDLTATLYIVNDKSLANIESNEITFDKYNGYYKVPNNTEIVRLNDLIKVSDGAIWSLSLDILGENIIKTKICEINNRENKFYIIVESEDKTNVNVYELVIVRRNIYKVDFLDMNNELIESYNVEEDSITSEPSTPEKTGYNFSNWNYDITLPITKDEIITPIFTPLTNTKYKIEYYFENSNNNLYSYKECLELEGTTDVIVNIDIKEVEGYSLNSKLSIFSLNINGDGSTVFKLYYKKNALVDYEIIYDLSDELGITIEGVIYHSDDYSSAYTTVISGVDKEYDGYSLVGWSDKKNSKLITYEFNSIIDSFNMNNNTLILYPVYASNTNNGAIIETYTDGGKTYAKVKGFTSNSSGNYVIPNYTKEGYEITKVVNGSFNSLEEFDLTLNDFICEIESLAFDGAKIKNLYNTDNIIKVGSYSFRNTSYLNSITFKNVASIFNGAFNTAMKDGTKLVFESPITYFESMDFWNSKATITLTTGFDGKTKKIDELLNGAKVDKLVISENYEVEELDLYGTSPINTLIIKSDYIKSFKDQTLTTNISNLILGKNMTISANMFIGSNNNTITLSNKVTIYFTEDRQQYKLTPGLSNSNCNFRFMSDDSNVNSKYDIYDSNFNKRTIDWYYKYCIDYWTKLPYLTINNIGDSHRVLTYGEAHSNPELSSANFTCWNYPGYSTDYESQRDKLNSCYCQFTPNSIINSSTIESIINNKECINNYSMFNKPFSKKEIILNEQQGSYPVTYIVKLNNEENGLIITNITDVKVSALSIPNSMYYSAKDTILPIVGIEMNGLNLSIHSLYIPETITSISEYAFSNCTNLSHVSIDAKISIIPVGLFENCPIIEFSMKYPSLVTTISNYAFKKQYMLIY